MPDPAGGGRRAVLVTRPEPGAGATGERLRAMGFEPVLAPLLDVEMRAVDLPPPGSVQGVLVASGNAVAGLPAAYHAVPLFAVGDATAARARAAGFAAVESADGDAAALAALAARRSVPGARLLLATGEGQGGALEAALIAGGFAVVRRAVYAARPVTVLPPAAVAALRAARLSAVLFFSAETARAFVRLAAADPGNAAALAGVEALAIGPAAAVALQALPWRAIRVAARPKQDEMLALLR